MPSVPINVAKPSGSEVTSLPQLLHTPGGLAVVEIQGTLNISNPQSARDEESNSRPIGRLIFPDAGNESTAEAGAWMSKIHFYVGKNQRLVGEVKKLARPYGVLAAKNGTQGEQSGGVEILDIVRYKLFFGGRPEFV